MTDQEVKVKKDVLFERLRELDKAFKTGACDDIMRNVREQLGVLKELRKLGATELEILWALEDTPRA